MARLDEVTAGGRNVLAFLDMLAASEGTIRYGKDDGYDVLFGGQTFSNGYVDHPRQRVTRTMAGKPITSSAAGRYQFLERTWDAIVKQYGFRGRFTPEAQDLAAIKLIKERGALPDVQAGRFEIAVGKCKNIWASLPGAGYGQPEHKLETLLAAYQKAGGVVA